MRHRLQSNRGVGVPAARLTMVSQLPAWAAAILLAGSLHAQAPVEVHTTSEYISTRDGTRLAVDVHLPNDVTPGAKLPVLVETTRYWRASEDVRTGARRPSLTSLDRFFLRHGYALVKVDAR